MTVIKFPKKDVVSGKRSFSSELVEGSVVVGLIAVTTGVLLFSLPLIMLKITQRLFCSHDTGSEIMTTYGPSGEIVYFYQCSKCGHKMPVTRKA